jgi:hypothetical protein
MITKHAIVLAIILGTASGSLVTAKQHGIGPAYDAFGNHKLPEQSSEGPSGSAPNILAQGRCYNGRCY